MSRTPEVQEHVKTAVEKAFTAREILRVTRSLARHVNTTHSGSKIVPGCTRCDNARARIIELKTGGALVSIDMTAGFYHSNMRANLRMVARKHLLHVNQAHGGSKALAECPRCEAFKAEIVEIRKRDLK